MANDLDPIFEAAAAQYGLPIGFLKAIGQQESGSNPQVRDSYQGAKGLMQMLPATAAAMGAQNPYDPAQAIPAAARYLREGLDATGTLSGAAAYYHGGPDRKLWGPKTANYVQSVGAIYNRMPQPQASPSTPPKYVTAEEALGYTGEPPAMASAKKTSTADDIWGTGGASDAVASASAVPTAHDVWGATEAEPPQQHGDPGWKGAVDAALGGVIEGVPIAGPYLKAGAVKAAAAMRSLKNDTKYSDELKLVQQMTQQNADAHPYLNTGGQVGGAVLGTAPLGATAAGARWLGLQGPTIASRMLYGAAGNAALGAADSTARGENPVLGAGFGALGGVAGPAVGGALGASANKLMDGVRYMMPTNVPGMSRSSANILGQVIGADDPAAVRSFLAQHGDLAMLADAGPSTTGLTGALALKPSDAKTVVTNKLMERAAGSNDRIGNQLTESLGPAEDPTMVARSIEAQRKAAAEPAYQAAHENAPPVDISKVVDTIDEHLKTAEGSQKTALQSLRDMLHEPQEVPVLNPDGSQAMGPGKMVRSQATTGVPKGTAVSLFDFIKRAGGINDEGGDLRSMGLHKLINPKGMSLDRAREAAAEQGYLGGDIDHAMANTFTHDLLDALGNGRPVYSAMDDALVAEKMATDRGLGPRSSGWTDGPAVPLTETAMVPKQGSRNLHNIREEIDKVINYDEPGLGVPKGAVARQQGSLQAVRGALDNALKTQVPGMREADTHFAASVARQEAVKRGYEKILRADGPNPQTFSADRASASPGENIAENKGIRGRVDRMFGTGTQRDAVTLNKLLAGGEDGYSAANLRTAFGDEPVNALLGTLSREKAFANTTNEVLQNSATARRTAANKLLEESAPGSTNLLSASLGGMAAQAGKSMIVDPLMRMIMESPNASRNLEIAKALTAQGASRDQILQSILKLNQRQGLISNAGNALAGAISGGANRLMIAAPLAMNR